MYDLKKSRSYELRKLHNADLIRRMRNGEPLNSIDSKASWYPPRPTIKKDAQEVARLYGSSTTEPKKRKAPTPAIVKEPVVQLLPVGEATPSFDEAS